MTTKLPDPFSRSYGTSSLVIASSLLLFAVHKGKNMRQTPSSCDRQPTEYGVTRYSSTYSTWPDLSVLTTRPSPLDARCTNNEIIGRHKHTTSTPILRSGSISVKPASIKIEYGKTSSNPPRVVASALASWPSWRRNTCRLQQHLNLPYAGVRTGNISSECSPIDMRIPASLVPGVFPIFLLEKPARGWCRGVHCPGGGRAGERKEAGGREGGVSHYPARKQQRRQRRSNARAPLRRLRVEEHQSSMKMGIGVVHTYVVYYKKKATSMAPLSS